MGTGTNCSISLPAVIRIKLVQLIFSISLQLVGLKILPLNGGLVRISEMELMRFGIPENYDNDG